VQVESTIKYVGAPMAPAHDRTTLTAFSLSGAHEREWHQIAQRHQLPQPECLFDVNYFRIDPQPFYSFAKVCSNHG